MTTGKSENRSVRHTKKRIREGLIALMQQKPIQNITVKELTDSIDLNRGTFYFHYQDIYDLLEQLESELLAQLEQKLSTPQETPVELITTLFLFFQENYDLCSLLLGPNGDMAFVENTKKSIAGALVKLWELKKPLVSREDYDYCSAYIINGFAGLIRLWFEHDMNRSPQEMAVFACNIMTGTLKSP